MPDLLQQLLLAPDEHDFALLNRAGGPGVEVLIGDTVDVDDLAAIPLPEAASGPTLPVLAVVPYRQVTERGFPCHDDQAPLRCLVVRAAEVVDLRTTLALLPADPVRVVEHGFDVGDDAYADTVRRVVAEEIGRGEGANFVIRRDYRASSDGPPARTALQVLRALLTDEPGAYWTFAVHAGDLTMVGATPERHVSVHGSEVLMNPISGTYRHPPSGPSEAGLLEFLADAKETEELFMVVDEELKMMSRICPGGGQVLGPYLKQMRALTHSEYLLRGRSDLDVREILRETMFAPTVTGSPVRNAARVITRYETSGRGYYSGVLALIDQDADGRRTLDAPILIRTAYLDPSGGVRVPVGATLVRHSDPDAEVAETRAKAAGVLRALGVGRHPAASRPRVSLALHPGVGDALAARNELLADFWLRPQRDEPAAGLAGRSALVVDAEDAWTDMLAAVLRRSGMTVEVRDWHDVPAGAAADLLVAGPGPGDPRDLTDPRIAAVHDLVRRRLRTRRPLLAVCLSHQVLATQLGLPVVRLAAPHQGTQRRVDLFGRPIRVGFYNTYAAVAAPGRSLARPGFDVAADPATEEVHALRGPRVASVQFHCESLLSPDGAHVLRHLAVAVLDQRAPAV